MTTLQTIVTCLCGTKENFNEPENLIQGTLLNKHALEIFYLELSSIKTLSENIQKLLSDFQTIYYSALGSYFKCTECGRLLMINELSGKLTVFNIEKCEYDGLSEEALST